ncbi:hypothetical protein L873DRAFT_524812 [Choiromyces venosus 120613-1]|uniref:Zn(2)-C6 fungal-type domain-containing protein n=1 Tax=Choiromyces venosus 120613-1 TaxID=1336337 RepID=A0A3N4KIG5_9PEZI|nr:hypothetical protein L873DRAFT_524812 [Choiromyces venosus 120613-1]
MFNVQTSQATSSPATATSAPEASSGSKEKKRSRSGCIVCKVRKVKCDERPGACSNCQKLDIDCPGYSPLNSSEAPEETVSAIFARAGRKRRRMVGSCVDCRASKSKCSSDRPTCERCVKRGITCEYDETLRGLSRSQSPKSRRSKKKTPTSASDLGGEELPKYEGWASTVLERRVSRSESEDWKGGAGLNGIDWLFSPNLPKSSARLNLLIETYFNDVHPCRSLSFLHKPTFMRALQEGTIEKIYGTPLILAMCALAAHIVYWDEVLKGRSLAIPDTRSPSDQPPPSPIPGDQWAKKAQQIIVSNFDEISPERLMALNLDTGQEDTPKTQNPDAITECEARRRLMWSCYILDLLLCSGVRRLMLWDPANIKVQLPCQERNYTLQIPCETESLYPIHTGSPGIRSSDNLGIEAYYIRLFHIRGKVLEQIRNPNPYGPPWSTNSPFQNLTNELVDWENTLPDSLLFNSPNVYVRRECRQLGAFFGLHLVYHQVFCDLYRISLPGYPFPAAATFNGAPDGFVAQCQNTCNVHAARISEIFEMSFTHGWKALVEPMCSVIAFESSKHQIVYFTACSSPGPERRKLWDALACNLAVNIKALDDIKGYSRAAEECVLSIQGLLERLNMSSILGPVPGYSGKRGARPSEIVYGDIHNLHQFATFRLVREGFAKPGSSTNREPPTPPRPGEHTLSNVRAVDAPQVATTHSPNSHQILLPPLPPPMINHEQMGLDQLGQPPEQYQNIQVDYEAIWAEIDFRVASESGQMFAWDPYFMNGGSIGGASGSGDGGWT